MESLFAISRSYTEHICLKPRHLHAAFCWLILLSQQMLHFIFDKLV